MLKMHRSMADVMKAMGGGKRGPMAGLANMLGFGGGGDAVAGADGGAREENAGRRRWDAAGRRACRRRCPVCRRNFPARPLLPAWAPSRPRRFPGLGKKK